MNRKINNKKQKVSTKVIMFWSAIILVTVAFFIVMAVKWYSASKVATEIDDITHLSGSEVFKQGAEGDTYFVFFYSSDPESKGYSTYKGLVDNMCEYVNFINNYEGNEKTFKLYAYNVNTPANEGVVGSTSLLYTPNYSLFKVSDSDLPVIIKYEVVKSDNDLVREYKAHYIGESAIEELLNQTMDKLK